MPPYEPAHVASRDWTFRRGLTGGHLYFEDDLAPAASSRPSSRLTMTAFYGFLIYLTFRLIRSGWWRALITGVALIVILGMGYGRIYVGEHWPSDVLAGYLFGTLWLAVTVGIYGAWQRHAYSK
jgi:undecaprenyl-diphosphatase